MPKSITQCERCAIRSYQRVEGDCADAERRLAELKDALRRIANYSAYGDYNEEEKKLFTERNRLAEDINNCAECARARKINWPPSGMCSTHYSAFMRIQDSIKQVHEHKETYEPRNIVREALAKLEEK